MSGQSWRFPKHAFYSSYGDATRVVEHKLSITLDYLNYDKPTRIHVNGKATGALKEPARLWQQHQTSAIFFYWWKRPKRMGYISVFPWAICHRSLWRILPTPGTVRSLSSCRLSKRIALNAKSDAEHLPQHAILCIRFCWSTCIPEQMDAGASSGGSVNTAPTTQYYHLQFIVGC